MHSPLLHHRLKIARVEAKLTQVQLAQKAKLTQRAISQYEKGTVEPTLRTFCKLAILLKKPYEYFLDTFYKEDL